MVDTPLIQKPFQAAFQCVCFLRFAFPYNASRPAHFFQRVLRIAVALLIAGKLWPPVSKVRSGWSCILAFRFWVLMPETAMHKNHFSAGGKNQIGFSWKQFCVQAVAVSHAVRQPPDRHLRFCVFAAYRPHIGAALFWQNLVQSSSDHLFAWGICGPASVIFQAGPLTLPALFEQAAS